jgi:REP element-mobilizing transposase RayT
MPQSLSLVYVHIVFSTKKREHFLVDSIQDRVFEYLGGICRNNKCNPIQIGGHYDHVHVLCTLSRQITQSDLLAELKRGSSTWIKDVDDKFHDFYWQGGFGIFSVSPKDVEAVAQYIRNQKEHHRKVSFKDEYLALLRKYGIPYDERYLWD